MYKMDTRGIAKCHTCDYHCDKCDEIRLAEIHKMKTLHIPYLTVTAHNKEDTLCWCCVWATEGGDNPCPYHNNVEPVPGWTAIKHDRGEYVSYHVICCPLFERG